MLLLLILLNKQADFTTNAHSMFHKKISWNSSFQKSSHNNKILIWGEAGVGKTTFTSKISQDWAEVVSGRKSENKEKLTEEQCHLLSNIGLVLYVVFRDSHENQSLDDIVQTQIFKAVGEESIKVSETKYHDEILLVCDGLDEVSYTENELLEIINSKKYHKLRCIVTCRPHASLGMSLVADAEIRLKGFSEKQAGHYVDMYFRQNHPSNRELAEQKSNKLLKEINSSPDLQEMAINPSMLQLLCKLFLATGKIAKDRATIFKDYTCSLLQHHHSKCEGKRISSKHAEEHYKVTLLKAGELALQGLKQSHLQLVFTKGDVTSMAGNEVYDIGFVTEIPSSDDIPKAQFIHKSLQEYLAAFFIVNSPGDVGMRLLMEFCSTSKGLMGSQIILTFITALSKKMGKIIQKQIRELVSSWASEDDISPKDRTSFLISMLKENRSLVFPLPNEIDINVKEYEASIGWFQKFLKFFGRKNTLEQFFDFDNRGVQKIAIVPGETFRLQLLDKFRKSSLTECSINFQKKVSVDDPIHLKALLESNNQLGKISLAKLDTRGVLDLFRNKALISSLHVQTSKHLNIIKIYESELEINNSISDALRHVPNHIGLDLSGNSFSGKSVCKAMIHNAAERKSLTMQDCGITIDTEIAEAISQLPEQANLDLSGNRVTKMDSRLLCHVIPVISNKNIDLSGLGVLIDSKVAEVICELPDEADVVISDNTITQMDVNLFSKLLYRLNKDSKVTVSNAVSSIETSLLKAIFCKSDNTHIDISCNDIYKQDVILSLLLTAKHWKNTHKHNDENKEQEQKEAALYQTSKQTTLKLHTSNTDKMNLAMVALISSHDGITCPVDTLTVNKEFTEPLLVKSLKQGNVDIKVSKKSETNVCIHLTRANNTSSLNMSNCNVTINKQISDAMVNLHGYVDISDNQLFDQYVCISLIYLSKQFHSLNMSNCGIKIDTEIAEAVSRLPDHTQLDLSGNHVTDKSACMTLIHKAATMKSLNIHNCMSNRGIQIDTEIAEAVSRLPNQTKLDLSGNQVTDKSACITLIHKAATMKSLSICNCGITIDTKIAEAVSRLPDHTQLDLSGNQVTDKSACITLIHKAATMISLSICNCGIKIDTEIAEAVSRIPDHTQLDLSVNQVTDKSACITLIHKAATMKSLNIHNCMSNCGIQIDTEIAEAVSRLPDHTQLDLSGNQVTDKSACITLIHKAATMKSLNIHNCMSNCGIKIDTEIAEAVSRLPNQTKLDLSGNQVTDKSACITLIHKAATMKSLSICNCGIKIDTKIAEAVSRLPDHTQLDLSGNQVTDKSACITLIHKAATMKSLSLCNCGIKIDTEIAEAVSRLPDHTQLDLSGNQVTDKSACITLIHKAATMKSLSLCNCGIKIDTKIAEAVSRLPDHTQLDLSGNQVTDKSACIRLIHKAATMKSLSLCNCGIKIDTEIAEAVSRLPDHTQLDLSGNQVTDKSACITLIHKAATMKSLNIYNCMSNCGIKIDTEIAEAVSSLPDHTQLDLSGNDITKMKPYLLSRILSYMTKQDRIDINGWGITVDEDIVRELFKLSKLQTLIINIGYYIYNNKLTPKAASELPHSVSSMPYLKVLYLDKCNISNDVLVDLTDSLYKHCPLLEELSLINNHLSSGVWEVVKHIQQMKNLRRLWLWGNPCVKDDKQRDKIKTTLHRSNPGLRLDPFRF